MKVLLYSNTTEEVKGKGLKSIVESRLGHAALETVCDFQGLKDRLHRLPRLADIAVLLAATHEQLDELLTIRDFLSGISLILVLPDQKKDTIAAATRLFPNFIGSLDSDLGPVGDVLEKMLLQRVQVSAQGERTGERTAMRRRKEHTINKNKTTRR
ncbi:MAG TPA: hypothetical protein PLM29_10075 [Deltaproteobacteria bacterium]|nr:hypothetical protein [Deltaproteobacteria bacterium]